MRTAKPEPAAHRRAGCVFSWGCKEMEPLMFLIIEIFSGAKSGARNVGGRRLAPTKGHFQLDACKLVMNLHESDKVLVFCGQKLVDLRNDQRCSTQLATICKRSGTPVGMRRNRNQINGPKCTNKTELNQIVRQMQQQFERIAGCPTGGTPALVGDPQNPLAEPRKSQSTYTTSARNTTTPPALSSRVGALQKVSCIIG